MCHLANRNSTWLVCYVYWHLQRATTVYQHFSTVIMPRSLAMYGLFVVCMLLQLSNRVSTCKAIRLRDRLIGSGCAWDNHGNISGAEHECVLRCMFHKSCAAVNYDAKEYVCMTMESGSGCTLPDLDIKTFSWVCAMGGHARLQLSTHGEIQPRPCWQQSLAWRGTVYDQQWNVTS